MKNTDEQQMKMTPAVITPLDEHMGLDIARSLARYNIPVYGIDSDPKAVGRFSKYCKHIPCSKPDDDDAAEYVQNLVDFGKKFEVKPVLYPLSDRHVLICSRNREVLQNYYDFVMPDKKTIELLTSKDGLNSIAEKYNIPAPKTIFINKSSNISEIAKSLNFPVVLKPTESTYWHDSRIVNLLHRGFLYGRPKVIYCDTPSQLFDAFARITPIDDRLVVQEVIPGEDSRLVYISFYLNRESKPLGIFAGKKYRIIPTGFGSASYVRSFIDKELEELALTILFNTEYKGLGGIEFKKDPRDEKYKLIEFNTRFGMWDGLSVKCGVDLPYISYCDILKLPTDSSMTYRENIVWIDWQRDIRAAIEYWKKGEITFFEWLQSIRGEKMSAIYSIKDWKPGIAFTFSLIPKIVKRLINNQI